MQTIYLDNASTSFPKPKCMIEGMQSYLKNIGANPYRGNSLSSRTAKQLVHETRVLLCQFLGVKDPNSISFTYNATYALNTLLRGVLKPGDHAITSSYDHNSVLRPLHYLQKDRNVSYDIWKCDSYGRFNIANLEKLIHSKTRLMIFSYASNVIGSLIPIHEIALLARKNNILLAIDVTQAVGHLDLELESLNIDMAAGTCHKALLGPTGLGFLYVRNQDIVESLVQGGGGFVAASLQQPEFSPAKFEAGTINFLGIAGLKNSLDWILSKKNELHQNCSHLIRLLIGHLSQIPDIVLYGIDNEPRVPIVSFTMKGIAPSQIESYLEMKYNIQVRSGLLCAPFMHEALGTQPNGTVRVSLGLFNTETHIKKLVKTLLDIHLK